MSLEKEVMALLEEANPATEVEDSGWTDMEAGTYLSRLQSREIDVDQSETLRDRRRWQIAAAAAVVIVTAGLAITFLTGTDEEAPVITDPPPTTVPPTTVQSTTIPETPDSEISGFWRGARMTIQFGESDYHIIEDDVVTDSGTHQFEEQGVVSFRTTGESARCENGDLGTYSYTLDDEVLELVPLEDGCDDRGIARTGSSFDATEPFSIPASALSEVRPWRSTSTPGVYQTTVFEPRVTFQLPPNWFAPAADTDSNFGMERLPAWIMFNTQRSESVLDRVAFFEGHEAVNVLDSSAVTVGSRDGVQLDFTVSSELNLILTSGLAGTATPEEKVRAWFIDVDGTVVTIYFGTTRPTFDSLVEDAQRIIDSVIWG